MSAVAKPFHSFDEYVALERVASGKSEYYRGQIFAMAGGSVRHNTISGNVFARLRERMRGSKCRPCNSDQRIHIAANGLSTYPDVSIVCDEIQVDSIDRDAVTNPAVIVEVLSKSSESDDRGKKFDLYRELESLSEYILIAQDEPQVERFVRQPDGSWLMTVIKGLDADLEIQSAYRLSLSEIYEDVKLGPEEQSSG